MGNQGFDWRNPKPRIKLKKACEYRGLNWLFQRPNWRNLKFVSQLKVKVYKFRTNDQNEKGDQLKGW
jgi:hypothetical protein